MNDFLTLYLCFAAAYFLMALWQLHGAFSGTTNPQAKKELEESINLGSTVMPRGLMLLLTAGITLVITAVFALCWPVSIVVTIKRKLVRKLPQK